MPPYIEVGRVFASDKDGEREIGQHIQHDNSQRGDVAEEAEDLACSEENADKQETHNLKDLLDMNRYSGCLMHRMDRLQGRRERPGLRHRIHHAASSVGTGDPDRQGAGDNSEEDEPPPYYPELCSQ